MPCLLGSYKLGRSKRLKNNVLREIDDFYSNLFYYGDTDSAYVQKKHWSTSCEKGFIGKCFGLGKDNYGYAGIFCAWFLSRKKRIAWFITIRD